MKQRCLIYCTKAKPRLMINRKGEYKLETDKDVIITDQPLVFNGKIVCECEVETEEIQAVKSWHSTEDYDYDFETPTMNYDELLKRSCLDNQQMENYLEFKGYALHLSNVKERVMELSKCHTKPLGEKSKVLKKITKAPQNMCRGYVWENDKWVKYLIISIQPQWCCLIGNKIKDIEVRRKVLKGMCD